jgi:long-subunit fatty acid transport protein
VLAFGYNRFKNYDEYLYFSGFSADSIDLGFDLDDDDGNLNYYPYDRDVVRTQEINQDGNLGAWSIGGGIQVSPRLAIGLTIDFYTGKSQYLMDFYQDDVDNNFNQYPADYDSYELHDQIISSFSGWGAKFGAMFHLTEHLRAGVTVDLPRSLIVHETYSTTDVLFFDDGFGDEAELASGEWEYVIKYPYKFSGGASLDMGPFTFAGSVEYRDWTQTEFDMPEDQSLSEDYQSLLDENRFFAQEFRPTLGYSAGGEFRLPGTGIALRGGYRIQPSPIIFADEILDREYISLGVGYNFDGNTVFNFGYTVGTWKKFSYDSYTPSGTSENIKSERFMAGITFRI